MNTLDSLTLRLWLNENKCFLQNAVIQKINQPNRRELVFTLRNQGETKKLYINIHPQFFHLCFSNRKIINAKHPPMFCMQLRKHLEGQRIKEIVIPDYERIIELYFQTYDEFSNSQKICLSIELMGKHSNIVLYNYDTNVILGCAHNISSSKSAVREMAGGLPYIYPPKQNKKDILLINYVDFYNSIKSSTQSLEKNISENYYYFCSNLIKEILLELKLNSPLIQEDIIKLYEKLKEVQAQPLSILTVIKKMFIDEENIDKIMNKYYSDLLIKDEINLLKNKLNNQIASEIKKINNNILIQKKLEKRIEKKDVYKKSGDLLFQNIYNINSVTDKIILEGIEIELDKNKNISQNAQKYYKLYNKLKTAKIYYDNIYAELLINKNYFEELKFNIENNEDLENLIQIDEEINPPKIIKKDEKINIEKIEINNSIIFIGKNNKQNDYIISKLADNEDYWFHALNTPGSHVLLKTKGEPSDDLILEAAKTAKKYSSAKDNKKASIIYTKRKFIKKPPKAPLGYVIFRNEKEIVVE